MGGFPYTKPTKVYRERLYIGNRRLRQQGQVRNPVTRVHYLSKRNSFIRTSIHSLLIVSTPEYKAFQPSAFSFTVFVLQVALCSF